MRFHLVLERRSAGARAARPAARFATCGRAARLQVQACQGAGWRVRLSFPAPLLRPPRRRPCFAPMSDHSPPRLARRRQGCRFRGEAHLPEKAPRPGRARPRLARPAVSRSPTPKHKELIQPESRMMLEGVIPHGRHDRRRRHVASRHMDLLDNRRPYDELLHVIIRTGTRAFRCSEESATTSSAS